MIFLIDKQHTEYQVVVYDSILELTERVEWQDVYEGKAIIVDETGTEYEWDATKKKEIGTIYNYTLIPTTRFFEYIRICLEMVQCNKNSAEFNFKL